MEEREENTETIVYPAPNERLRRDVTTAEQKKRVDERLANVDALSRNDG